eukprot:jgi/Psemu1/44241/gm1.44241_g
MWMFIELPYYHKKTKQLKKKKKKKKKRWSLDSGEQTNTQKKTTKQQTKYLEPTRPKYSEEDNSNDKVEDKAQGY